MRTLIIAVALARLAAAQTPSAPAPGSGATIAGIVRDSLAHGTLAGAVVQLADADPNGRYSRTTSSDSLGRFSFNDVPDGRYLIGFLHPVLDSIGIEGPAREVVVHDGRAAHVDLAVPSARRLRAAICRAEAKNDSTGIVVGFVRTAGTGESIEGASVTGQWAEFTLTRGGLTRAVPRLVATTAANGWFALCGVPAAGTMVLSAAHGADSTASIEIDVSAEGFAHRDLSLGAARATIVMDSSVVRSVAADDSARHADSVAVVPRLVRTGTGRLTGTVRRAAGDAPLVGAQVSILDGPQARTDDRGVWTIADAPLGSRMLEVRAVGYYPDRRVIDVSTETPPIALRLSTLKAVLDTVRVRATQIYARDRNGFQQRRRVGVGRYITPEDVARRHPLYLSDLLRTMPGLYLQNGADSFSPQFMMRDATGYCSPSLYLDGMPMLAFNAGDLDATVQPGDVTGIEVYSSASVPPQFQRGFSSCGSIVVWTR